MKWIKTDSGYQTECGRGKIVRELDPSTHYPTAIWVPSVDGEEFDFAEEKLKLAKHAVEIRIGVPQ